MSELMLHWRDLSPSPLNTQVRGEIDEGGLGDLAENIKSAGVVQSLTVFRTPDGPTAYQILMGERRWRAARKLGEAAPLLPCVVREKPGSKLDQLILMGIENLQRDDLPPVTEARYYQGLLDEGLDEKGIVRQVGVKLWRVKERLSLLKLPEPVQVMIDAGRLPATFAKYTKDLPETMQVELARKVAGRTHKDIKLLATMAKKKLGHPEKKKRGSQKDEIETLRQLAAQLCSVVVNDAALLQRAGVALEAHGDDLAVEVIDQAHKIKMAFENATKCRGANGRAC